MYPNLPSQNHIYFTLPKSHKHSFTVYGEVKVYSLMLNFLSSYTQFAVLLYATDHGTATSAQLILITNTMTRIDS